MSKKSWKKGLWAEKLSCWWLRAKGYRILQQRYKTKLGEIDIIAQRHKSLAFVEVKARKNFETGMFAISPQQQGRIQQAAEIFLSKHGKNQFNQIRFDVMIVMPWRWPQHVKDAWRI